MKIRILSDLHLEFMRPPQASAFVRRLSTDCDVLVLAGDVSNADGISDALRRFGDRFANVVYVAGNHELYGSSPDIVATALERAPDNVHVLEMGAVRIGSLGQRFVGCSLWFPQPKRGDKSCLTDFHAIQGFEPWVYERNAASVQWLAENVQPGDVVVTHHLPSPQSVHPKYAGSTLNDFFVSDVSPIIKRRAPTLWAHGHTHESADYWLGTTRIVCNPYGYAGHEVNAAFDPEKCVEV